MTVVAGLDTAEEHHLLDQRIYEMNCSIVIRAYNEEKHIGRLLEGISAADDQGC